MPDPSSWDLEVSDSVKQQKREYDQELSRKVIVAGVRRKPSPQTYEAACDQQDAFKDFLDEIYDFPDKKVDPSKLPPATDRDGAVIPDHFILENDPWVAYLWRAGEGPRVIAVLLFEEKDRQKALAKFSPVTG